jgi:RNA polymerase sigma-70 factor (ECF subfamily)
MSRRAERLSDEQLMTNLDGREVERSISTLYERYSRTVFEVSFKILGDRSLAEELVQEVFLKVWRSGRTFDPSRSSFSTWLYRVTRSVAVDLYRKRAHRIRQVSDGDMHIATARDFYSTTVPRTLRQALRASKLWIIFTPASVMYG